MWGYGEQLHTDEVDNPYEVETRNTSYQDNSRRIRKYE